ncbi:MAG: class I mannose-6-phosphate isomerase [Planctomycetota bacterium]|nr:class I mannose-6-phosphate isomerase [Planctomycetota bacterium]
MVNWYPLQFTPLFRRYIWGGRRLSTILNKPIGSEGDYAESWELVDRGHDQSIVTSGSLAGATLHELVADYGRELFGGDHIPTQFPLLLKFLDANTDLSVQVHPDDARGSLLVPPDLGKTEAWLILHADPGSKLYAGLRTGCTRKDFQTAVASGKTAECLHVCEPQAGECYFIPAGTVHALGAGLVVAEIQQASDTTYRLFDWNRTGPDGKPRALHIEQGLEAIDYGAGPVSPQRPIPTDRSHVRQLVQCDKFVLNEWRFSADEPLGGALIGGDDQCRILAVISGEVQLTGDSFASLRLRLGEVSLLPAQLGAISIQARSAVMLEMHL